MVDKPEVMQALRDVLDPEIHMSIVELNMVKDLQISGNDVKVTVALTVPGCPLIKTIEADVKKVLSSVPSIGRVEVETTSMSKQELAQLQAMLQNRVIQKQPPGRPTSSVNQPGINRLAKGGIRNIIAIISGKGGVGKSFVTSLLAVELRRLGYEVGILDADVTGPSIAKVFGLKGPLRVSSQKKVLPAVTGMGIRVVSMNLILDEEQMPVIVRGPIVNSVIRQMFQDVEWGDLHYLLVDLPPGTSDAPLTVFQSLPLDGVLMVSTPQDLAVMIVGKAINMAKTLSEQIAPVQILGLIENMSYTQCPDCGKKLEIFGPSRGAKAAREADIPFLGSLPIDPKIVELSDVGRIEQYSNPNFQEVVTSVRLAATKMLRPVAEAIAWHKEKAAA
jgi:Mrp family chromosome partitioning ATPase